MGAIFIFDLFRVKGGIIRGSRQGFLLVTLKFIQQNYLSLVLAVPCHAVLSNAQRVTHPWYMFSFQSVRKEPHTISSENFVFFAYFSCSCLPLG